MTWPQHEHWNTGGKEKPRLNPGGLVKRYKTSSSNQLYTSFICLCYTRIRSFLGIQIFAYQEEAHHGSFIPLLVSAQSFGGRQIVENVCVFGFNVAFNNFSVISHMSGCNRELNAHFYSAASLKYHVPDTRHDTTPSHIILTLGRTVLALPRKSECQARSS